MYENAQEKGACVSKKKEWIRELIISTVTPPLTCIKFWKDSDQTIDFCWISLKPALHSKSRLCGVTVAYQSSTQISRSLSLSERIVIKFFSLTVKLTSLLLTINSLSLYIGVGDFKWVKLVSEKVR